MPGHLTPFFGSFFSQPFRVDPFPFGQFDLRSQLAPVLLEAEFNTSSDQLRGLQTGFFGDLGEFSPEFLRQIEPHGGQRPL